MSWKQRTDFSTAGDWIFASPLKIGRLPYSCTGVSRELERAAKAAGIGHLATHAFRHTYRYLATNSMRQTTSGVRNRARGRRSQRARLRPPRREGSFSSAARDLFPNLGIQGAARLRRDRG